MAAPDVIVVGGGPAGASTAFRLARSGVRVTVLERARFPRAKACAECLSPQASRVLADMGVLSGLEAEGAWLRGMIVRSPDGRSARGDYAAAHGFRAYRDGGLSIRREILDGALIGRARDAGAEILEDTRVTDLLRDSRGRVTGVRVLDRSGSAFERRAPLVVGADGLRSVVARRLGLARTFTWPRRISLVAHYRDVGGVTEYGEMHVERDGFVGIADVGGGVTTVAAVFPASRARALSPDRSSFLDGWLASRPQLRPRFARARREAPAIAVGPFASHARRSWHAGALLVGDAADFFDPFTGEGIYSGLRGGELAAQAATEILGPDARAAAAAYGQYDSRRREEFAGKWRVERIIGASVAWPALVNRATRALAGRKELADLLVGVTGDFVPPARVLQIGYLAKLFVLPVPTPSRTACR
jgi:menaquinone-9 beta-reductase